MTDTDIVQAAREAATKATDLIGDGTTEPSDTDLISTVIDLTGHLRNLLAAIEPGQEHPIGDDEVLLSAELHAREAGNAVALIHRIDPDLAARLRADLDGTSRRGHDKVVFDLLATGPHHLVSDAVDTVIAQIKRVGR